LVIEILILLLYPKDHPRGCYF